MPYRQPVTRHEGVTLEEAELERILSMPALQDDLLDLLLAAHGGFDLDQDAQGQLAFGLGPDAGNLRLARKLGFAPGDENRDVRLSRNDAARRASGAADLPCIMNMAANKVTHTTTAIITAVRLTPPDLAAAGLGSGGGVCSMRICY